MKSERNYLFIFVMALLFTVATFVLLFEKYSYTTLFYVAQQCYQSLSTFFTSPFHLIGLVIFSISLGLSAVFLLKVIFSTWKTQQKMRQFARSKLKRIPHTLLQLCIKHQINPSQVIVVKSHQPLAFAMGMYRQHIVITTKLIRILSKKELEAVLLHEHYHITHHHGAVILCAEIISSTLSLFPALLDTLTRMKAIFEISADHYAEQVQQTPRYVHSAIGHVMAYQNTRSFAPGFAVNIVEQRLQVLDGERYSPRHFSSLRMGWTICSLALLVTLVFFPTQQYASELSPEMIQNQQCDSALQCSIQCRDAKLIRELKQQQSTMQSEQLHSAPQ
jgi:beta-lactamase regulating signal transducer with metallopeptidase domain